MPEPRLLMVMATDVFGRVESEPVTVDVGDEAIRFVWDDGSDAVFDRRELLAALQVGQRKAA